jgi:hypothetical protein
VELWWTNVSGYGVRSLREALPDVKINRGTRIFRDWT